MGLIYIIRHGQSVVNAQRILRCKMRDGDLTDLGLEQAGKAAEWFADKSIDMIYASPFDRTQQTAGIVGKKLGLTPLVQDDLGEIDCGDLEKIEGQPAFDAWHAVFDRWRGGDFGPVYPNGESFHQCMARFTRALRLAHPDQNTLLVSHGGITLGTIPYLCVNAAAMQRLDHLDFTGIVILEHYDQERWNCVSWNLIEHLA